MRFQVPQFINIEPKIVGPLTIKQFAYFVGAGLVSFLAYFFVELWLWTAISVVVFFFAVVMVAKFNGEPVSRLVKYAFLYFWRPRRYAWEKEERKEVPIPIKEKAPEGKIILSPHSNLKNLWRDLMTTKNPIPKRELVGSYWGKKEKEKFLLLKKLTGEKEVVKRVDYR